MFDTLITNGTIIDGSNKKSYKADIGIIGKKIDTIGVLSNAESKETINAKDSIVCPGFIDVHSHDDFQVVNDKFFDTLSYNSHLAYYRNLHIL